MSVTALATIEWLKTRRRMAFWMGLLFFFGMMLIGPVFELFIYRRTPERYQGTAVWPSVAGSLQSFGLLVMLVMVTLLTASEKTWRTERQNVIDGLSRTRYFLGKLMLVAAVALVLWLGTLLIGTLFEIMFRQLGTPAERAFVSGLFARVLLSGLVFLLFCGAIALFFGSVASSSGAALALAFLFLLVQPAVAAELADRGGLWADLTAYFPMQVLGALGSVTAHDPQRLAAYLETARQSGAPLMLGAPMATFVALSSTALFCAGAWWSIRSRDL